MTWIVECRFAKKVSFIFLTKGNMKNICDQDYNLIKLTYHKKNIYTEKQLDETHSKISFFTLHCMSPYCFKNFDKWHWEVNVDPSDGITKYHHFTFEDGKENLTSYGYEAFNSEAEPKLSKNLNPSSTTSMLLEDFTPDERKECLLSMKENLEFIAAPGLSEQKQ